MTDLAEFQFEILPEAEAEDGFVFGIGSRVSIDGDGGFDPGEGSWESQDSTNTRRGAVGFGRDVPSPKTWLWSSHVDGESVEEAVAALEDMSAIWTPEAAMQPRWLTSLRYSLAGRTRRVFGRPRRFSAPPSNRILTGYVPVTHDFQCVDRFTYDDLETVAEIAYSSVTTGGGFSFPNSFPLATSASDGNGSQQIFIGGNARCYPKVRFNGPWTNPSLDTGDWKLRWKGTVPAAGWIEIDARPWQLTVLDHNGDSVADGLDRTTWLEDIWFAPRTQPLLILGGNTSSGTATLSWRNTWTSI